MSYFDDASLVMIPSGYKTSKVYSVKPTDGTGDLAFTRSNDTATRVGSDGLIEKVRTNVVLQSNTFNTTWLTTDATITSGATDPNGGTTAWTLANTAASGIIQQAATLAGLRSVSIYAKQGTHRYLYMGAYAGSGTDSYQVFDLQDGVIPTGSKGRIESIGGGWFRCTSFGADGTTGGVQIFPSNSSLGAGTTNGNILIWKCQYESGDIATPYIATTTAAVSVGPVANVPRLDYLGSSCPRLLLEPQRTNSATYSEQIDNAAWSKDGATISANSTTSPDGFVNADKVVENTANGEHAIFRSVVGTGATFSFFAKAAGRNFVAVLSNNGAYSFFNIGNGTLGTIAATSTATITAYGNGWYRCTLYNTHPTFGAVVNLASASGTTIYTGDGTSGAFIWGAQFEASATYATSYIPTLGASVTRGADTASKTSATALIGQTEGTLFMELNIIAANPDYHSMFQVFGDANNRVAFGQNISSTNLFLYINASGVTTFLTTTTPAGSYKIALAYKSGNSVLYVNGAAAITTANTFTFATALSTIFVNNFSGNEIGIFKNAQALLFKTRLSNADLAALTA